jgi:hypothetical protein
MRSTARRFVQRAAKPEVANRTASSVTAATVCSNLPQL